MIQPKRFEFWMYQKITDEGQLRATMEMEFSEYGRFVHWDDYAALAAENERLRSASFVTAVPSEEYERLKAENERLRKAGDELYKWAGAENRPPQQVYAAWHAAKEGTTK